MSIALMLIGAALLATGNVAAWAAEVAQDPDTYRDGSVLRLDDGSLALLINQRVTEAVMSSLDLDGLVGAALPFPLDALGAPAEDLGRTAVDNAVAAVLDQPSVASMIDQLESRADDELLALVLDESTLLRLDGDTVILDLDPLVQQAEQRIDDFIPDTLANFVPGLDAATLVPDDIDGGGVELAVAEMPAIAEARGSLDTLRTLPAALLVSGLIAALAGLVVARRRDRALTVLGIGLAGAVALSLVAAHLAGGGPLHDAIAPLEEIAGQSFTAVSGSTLLARSLLAAGLGCTIAAAGWAWTAIQSRPTAAAQEPSR